MKNLFFTLRKLFKLLSQSHWSKEKLAPFEFKKSGNLEEKEYLRKLGLPAKESAQAQAQVWRTHSGH